MSDREVPLRQAREQLGELVEAAHHGQVILITKYDRPYARLVPLADDAVTEPDTNH